MKNLLLSLALLIVPSSLLAQATLTVGDASGFPGQTSHVPVSIESTTDVSGFQFEIARIPSISSITAEIAGVGQTTDKTVSCISTKDLTRCVVVGLTNSTAIPDGVVLQLAVVPNTDFTSDVTILPTNLMATSPTGSAVTLNGVSGTLTEGFGPCDLDGDGQVGITDVQAIINATLQGSCSVSSPTAQFQEKPIITVTLGWELAKNDREYRVCISREKVVASEAGCLNSPSPFDWYPNYSKIVVSGLEPNVRYFWNVMSREPDGRIFVYQPSSMKYPIV